MKGGGQGGVYVGSNTKKSCDMTSNISRVCKTEIGLQITRILRITLTVSTKNYLKTHVAFVLRDIIYKFPMMKFCSVVILRPFWLRFARKTGPIRREKRFLVLSLV